MGEEIDMSQKILEQLKAIRHNLDLLLFEKAEVLRGKLETEYLRTEKQKAMYDYFDGDHSIEEIAGKVKVTHEAVRLLVSALEEKRLIEVVREGRKKFPRRIL